MSSHLMFLLIGLGTGATYAALALGLVTVFKGTGVVNLSQGAFAMWAAFVVDEIRSSGDFVLPVGRVQVGQSLVTALVLGVLSAAALGFAVHLLVFRPLRRAPALAKVVASVGLMITMQAVAVLRFGTESRAAAPVLPNEVVRWGSVSFPRDRLYLAAIVVALTAALWAYFRFTLMGLATRGAAEDEEAASLAGYSTDRLGGVTWILATAVTGVVAVLAAPSTGLNTVNFTLLVVPALAVAVVGRLSSLGIACGAGLALGAVQSEIALLSSKPWWPDWAGVGVFTTVPLVLIIATLFVTGDRLPVRGTPDVERLPAVRPAHNRPVVVAGATLAALAAIVLTQGSYRFGLVSSMILAIVALSLVLLTGLIGQISLAQAAFAGVAGFTLSKLTTHWHVAFPLSLLFAGLAATVVGIAVSLPALRIRGAQLAVVTLSCAVTVEQFVFRNPSFSPPSGNPIEDPSLLGIDLSVRSGETLARIPFAVMVLLTLVLIAVAVGNLTRSNTGRAFLAVRSNERAAAAIGINVPGAKLIAFGFSSFIAGVGGALIGYSRGQLSVDSFTVLVGLSVLAYAYLAGITTVSGALIAGALGPLGVVYVFLDRNVDIGKYYLLVSGLSLVLTAVFNPSGMASQFRAFWDATLRHLKQMRSPASRSFAAGDLTPAVAQEEAPSHAG